MGEREREDKRCDVYAQNLVSFVDGQCVCHKWGSDDMVLSFCSVLFCSDCLPAPHSVQTRERETYFYSSTEPSVRHSPARHLFLPQIIIIVIIPNRSRVVSFCWTISLIKLIRRRRRRLLCALHGLNLFARYLITHYVYKLVTRCW